MGKAWNPKDGKEGISERSVALLTKHLQEHRNHRSPGNTSKEAKPHDTV